MLYLLHVPRPKCFSPEHTQILRWAGNKELLITLHIISYLSSLSLQKKKNANPHTSFNVYFGNMNHGLQCSIR
jgi:hypothetical protein